MLRRKADTLGGRHAFERLREQAGLGDRTGVLDKTVVSKLLRVMEELPAVTAWRATLTEKQRADWASPSAVLKHCPVFLKPEPADPMAEPVPTPMDRLKIANEDLHHRIAHLEDELAAARMEAGGSRRKSEEEMRQERLQAQHELEIAQHELEIARLATQKAIAESKSDIAGMPVEERIQYIFDLETEVEDLRENVDPDDVTVDVAAAWWINASDEDRKKFLEEVGGIHVFMEQVPGEELQDWIDNPRFVTKEVIEAPGLSEADGEAGEPPPGCAPITMRIGERHILSAGRTVKLGAISNRKVFIVVDDPGPVDNSQRLVKVRAESGKDRGKITEHRRDWCIPCASRKPRSKQ